MVLALADGLIERGEDRYYIAGLQARARVKLAAWRIADLAVIADTCHGDSPAKAGTGR